MDGATLVGDFNETNALTIARALQPALARLAALRR